MHKEGVIKADFVKKMHEKIKLQIQQQNEKYTKYNNKGKREIIFEEGDLVWLHLRKDRFPTPRKSKLSPRGDEPFQVLKRVNNNSYKLDLPLEYGVHDTFNVIHLSPFVGTNDEDELDLRTNHGSQSPNHEDRLDQEERLATRKERIGREGSLPMERLDVELDRLGPLTRSMAKHVQAQVNEATDGREKTLYMLHKVPIGVLSN